MKVYHFTHKGDHMVVTGMLYAKNKDKKKRLRRWVKDEYGGGEVSLKKIKKKDFAPTEFIGMKKITPSTQNSGDFNLPPTGNL